MIINEQSINPIPLETRYDGKSVKYIIKGVTPSQVSVRNKNGIFHISFKNDVRLLQIKSVCEELNSFGFYCNITVKYQVIIATPIYDGKDFNIFEK